MDDQDILTTLVTPLPGLPPAISWRWEAETDILSGSYRQARHGEKAEALELSSPDGAVIVLDVIEGELCGLDVVIWPNVETHADLHPPAPRMAGRVSVPVASEPRQLESELAVDVDGREEVFHLAVGPRRPTTSIQVADHLLIEVDGANALAGFWLTAVPPFPSEE